MKHTGTLIHQSNEGAKVYMVISREEATLRVSAEIYVELPDGEISSLYTIRRSAVFCKKNAFDFLFDLDADFSMDDILEIQRKVETRLASKTEKTTVGKKVSISKVWEQISLFIRVNAKDIREVPESSIFVKDGYGFVECKMFSDYFASYGETLGYEKLELLKNMKLMGMLMPSKSRVYDVQVKIKEKQRYFYRFVLADIKEEKEEEEIEIC